VVEGYFTLEATLLFPIIIVVYLGVFYMGFYQYDRCIAEQNLRSVVLQGSRSMEEMTCADIGSRYEKLVKNSLAAATVEDVQVEMKQGRIEGKVKGVLDIPVLSLGIVGKDGKWRFSVGTVSRKWEPAFWLRLQKRLSKEHESGKSD